MPTHHRLYNIHITSNLYESTTPFPFLPFQGQSKILHTIPQLHSHFFHFRAKAKSFTVDSIAKMILETTLAVISTIGIVLCFLTGFTMLIQFHYANGLWHKWYHRDDHRSCESILYII